MNEPIVIPDAFRSVIENGHCCICTGSLKDSHLNLIQVQKIAKWPFPVWSNLFVPEAGNRAMAIVCDNCVDEETGLIVAPPVEVIQVDANPDGEGVYQYHSLTELEDAEPLTPEMLAEGKKKIASDIAFENMTYELPRELSNLGKREILIASQVYILFVSREYLDAIENPNDLKHNEFLEQLDIARVGQKKTLILYDSRVEERIEAFKLVYLRGIDVISYEVYDPDATDEAQKEQVDRVLNKLQEAYGDE